MTVGKKECPGLDSLPAGLYGLQAGEEEGRREGNRGMIGGRLVYRWRLVRSLVLGHREQLL